MGGVMSKVLLLLVSVLSACGTVANPRSCLDGTCPTEEYPFCDTDGSFAGTPQTCIAVECEPNAFTSCRGDIALTCNANGTDYDMRECSLGCEEGIGCRVCRPNETVCANGAVQTCDAAGDVVSSEPCALGCFESEPRCRDIDPSNGLATFADAVDAPQDVDLTDVGIDPMTGTIGGANGQIAVPSFLLPAPTNGVAVRVFVIRGGRLGNITVQGPQTYVPFGAHPAVAFVGTHDIVVDGSVNVTDSDRAAAGSFSSPTCDGQSDRRSNVGSGQQISGGGGGGHATAGARGGAIAVADENGRAAGGSSGTATLVPLRGGCPSGLITGGGAIQISTRGKLSILGVINVSGGVQDFKQDRIAGGGAGGGVLLEGATVELGPAARLLALGGGGASYLNRASGSDTDFPSVGAPCNVVTQFCGAGGNGATSTEPATAGGGAAFTNSGLSTSGGGGGGVGRVRINTASGTYDRASSAIEAAIVTNGTISTR